RQRRILDRRVGAADMVAGTLERLERLLHPSSLRGPVHDRLREQLRALQKVLADRRVEGELHLVDRDAVRFELQRLLDAAAPVLLGLAQHAGDEVDVDLREVERASGAIRLADFRRAMRAAVDLEDAVVEILDAEAQTRDAHSPDGGELRVGQRARLALEGDFFGRRPRRHRGEPADQALELLRREKRRRAAAEVHEVERASGYRGKLPVELPLARERVEILADLGRILVGVDAKVTEMTALPAERNVEVQPERNRRVGRRRQRGTRVAFDGLRRPDRKRRICGNEVTADIGLIGDGTLGLVHGILYPKQYNRPSCEPTTTRPAAIAGDAVIASPASNSHVFLPVAASSTYSLPSLEPT